MNRLYYETTRIDRVITSKEAAQQRRTLRQEVAEAEYAEISVQEVPEIPHGCVLSDLSLQHFEEKTRQTRQDLLTRNGFDRDIIAVPNPFLRKTISASRFIGFTNRPFFTTDPKFEYIIMVNRGEEVTKLMAKLEEKGQCMLYGPQGSGKTFVVILLVVQLTREGHFVVYINNAAKLLNDIVDILSAKLRSISNAE